MLVLGEETAPQAVVGCIVWAFRTLKKPRSREMSARGYSLHSVCPQLSFPSPIKRIVGLSANKADNFIYLRFLHVSAMYNQQPPPYPATDAYGRPIQPDGGQGYPPGGGQVYTQQPGQYPQAGNVSN